MGIFKWIKNNPIRSMFLVPILLVATISISHVIVWYDMANPYNWAIFLSIAIEIGAISALIAATNRIKGGIWFMFGIVTFIQMVGNIFYSYNEIDENGNLFKSWVELTGPLWDMIGSDPNDIPAMKRWLSLLTGGLLPIISLTSLHFFVKYEDTNSPKENNDSPKNIINETIVEEKDLNDSPKKEKFPQTDVNRVWETVKKLKSEGKLPTNVDNDDEEPSALANSQYRNEEILDDTDETEQHHLIEESILEEDILDVPSKQENGVVTTELETIEETKGEKIVNNFKKIVKPKKNNGITRLGE